MCKLTKIISVPAAGRTMPPHREPPSLLQQSSQQLAKLISKIILDTDKVTALNDYLETLPGLYVEEILNSSIQMYTTQCRRENVALEAVQFGHAGLPTLAALIENQVTPSMTRIDFTYLLHLGTLSANAFGCFHQILDQCLNKVPNLQSLNLKSPNSRTSLPSITADHLLTLSKNCPNLVYLDISFILGLKNEDLLPLISGCPLLQFLYIYDCGIGEKSVKTLALNLKHLQELGYKEMGTVLKKIAKDHPDVVNLKFKHINHLGGRMRKTSVSSLRFKRSLSEATAKVCSQVTNLKCRVQDTDVEGLAKLTCLTSVELLFNVGRPTVPALGTASFLQIRGQNLTSVAIICSAISMVHIKLLGETCPFLQSLWLRSNHFQVTKGGREEVPEEFIPNHSYFQHLKTLYFRVGEGELALSFVPNYVLHYLLRNAGRNLRELIIALRCYFMEDDYFCNLLIQRNLQALTKLIICVPGLNNLPAVIPLSMKSVHFVLDFCLEIKTIGNLLSWTLNKEEFEICRSSLESNNYDIELICRHTVMH